MPARPAARASRTADAVRVLIVDDELIFAEGLAIALRREHRMITHVATDADAVVTMAESIDPHVVIVDPTATGTGGLRSIRRAREAAPQARILALAAREEDIDRARAVEAGAVGYLPTTASVMEVATAVRRVYSGDVLIDMEEVNRLLRVLRKRRHQEATERQRVKRLTPRQTEILQLMADGVSSREIARQLSLSPNTLRTHVYNILTRLGTHTKMEAMALALRQGKISPRG